MKSVQSGSNDEKPDYHSKIELGEELLNPYSVEAMQDAFDYYNSLVENSDFEGKEVSATHYYIKITPENESHLEFLDNLDKSDDVDVPVIHDFPLHLKIITEGDYYVMPQDEEDLYHPAYTVIPVNYQFSTSLPYTILDELYYPIDNEFNIETIALVFANWQEDILAQFDQEIASEDLPELIEIWTNEESEAEKQDNAFQKGWFSNIFGRRYRPTGRVTIENTDNGIYEPLQKAKISTGRSFWWKYTYTDNNGNFTATKKYRGKVRIRAKWRSYTATVRKTWNEVLGFWVSDHLMTMTRGNNGRTKQIGYTHPHNGIFGLDLQGGHLWVKGTTHNGLVKYNDYASLNGIEKSVSYANVWAWSRGSDSSAPMLYRYPLLPSIAQFANIGQANVWQNITAFAGARAIGIVPPWLRPDILFQGLGSKYAYAGVNISNTVRCHQLVFHEAGHYSHARKAGQAMWAQNMAATISNSIAGRGSYSDGSHPSYSAGERISMVEGWGTLTEFKITNFYYGKSYLSISADLDGDGFTDSDFLNATASGSNPSVDRFMENFDMYQRPITVSRFDDKSWFMHGLMWDLLDNRNEIETSPGSGNNISDYLRGNGSFIWDIHDPVVLNPFGNPNDLGPVFRALESQVEDGCDLYWKLKSQNPNQHIPLRTLFLSYGFDCENLL